MIYIKNICKSDERLIVEKQIYKKQSFYKFECCFVDTLLILFFRFNLCCDVYFFF